MYELAVNINQSIRFHLMNMAWNQDNTLSQLSTMTPLNNITQSFSDRQSKLFKNLNRCKLVFCVFLLVE